MIIEMQKRSNVYSRPLSIEVKVILAPLELRKIVLVVFGCFHPESLINVEQKSLFRAAFDDKG